MQHDVASRATYSVACNMVLSGYVQKAIHIHPIVEEPRYGNALPR